MQSETGTLSGGDHRWFKSRSSRKNRRVARDNNNNNNNNHKYNNNVDTNLGNGRTTTVISDVLTLDITVAT